MTSQEQLERVKAAFINAMPKKAFLGFKNQFFIEDFNMFMDDAAQAAIDAMSDNREANQWQPLPAPPIAEQGQG